MEYHSFLLYSKYALKYSTLNLRSGGPPAPRHQSKIQVGTLSSNFGKADCVTRLAHYGGRLLAPNESLFLVKDA